MEEARRDAGMTDKPTVDVELAGGVISFDGRVIETFGFIYSGSKRVHIAMVKKIAYEEGKDLEIRDTSGQLLSVSPRDEDAAKLPELTSLVEQMRAAAPNLQS